MHLVRLNRLGIPTESREGFSLPVRAGLMESELGGHLETMIGFRNIAVHNYRELDMDIVKGILAHRLDDLRGFAAMLVRFALP